MEQLKSLAWREEQLGEALAELARRCGLIAKRPPDRSMPRPPSGGGQNQNKDRWIEMASACLGFEAEPARIPFVDAKETLSWIAPALLCIENTNLHYLAILKSTSRYLTILAPNLTTHKVGLDIICASLRRLAANSSGEEMEALLEAAQIPLSRRPAALQALLTDQNHQTYFDGCWQLQLAPNSGFWRKALRSRLPHRLAAFVLAYIGYYSLWILSWWILGQSALQGRIDRGWFIAWALLLFSQIPFQLFSNWAQRMTALGAGLLLKQHLLYGATRLDPGQVKMLGIGQLLGKVIESEIIELDSLTGGLLQIVALLELAAALAILRFNSVGVWESWLLAGWIGIAVLMAWQYQGSRQRWTRKRLDLSQYLIEQMAGYRTCLAQQLPEFRHLREDQQLEEYLKSSMAMDRQSSFLTTLIPRGWLILGLLSLTGECLAGSATPAAMAIALGGLLLAYRALAKLCGGLLHLVDARITWKQIAILFEAAGQPTMTGSMTFALGPAETTNQNSQSPLLVARELSFRYPHRSFPVLTHCDFQIQSGDQILLEGTSGAGKSTLIALLMGLYPPQSGLILFSGLDRQTLGSEAWQQRILAVPQFHQNHLLTETLAFNLLMGRQWPPRNEDLRLAETICRDLGLGVLLDRMPAGLQQMVGEGGWNLSHGERSRVYIARALLQGAPLLILDEGCTFLDPENLERVVNYVKDHAPTLILVAHL